MKEFLLSFLTVASIHFLAVISPGPDFVIVTRNAFLYTRKVALYTALGISLGIIVHATYCLFGLALVIAKSMLVFTIIKTLGAIYLIYIGTKACMEKNASDGRSPYRDVSQSPTPLSSIQALKQGFLCNVLNPKATLFFLGIFTLVIKPETPWGVQLFYAIWIMVVTFIWFALLSVLITHPQVRTRIWRIQPAITKIMGVLLILFGLDLLIMGQGVFH